jgi:DNA-binding PadR family transcriptional regulator
MDPPVSPPGDAFRALQRSQRQQALLSLIADCGRAISTTELSKLTGQTLGATAHHVRALARHGLIENAGIERVRGAIKTYYLPTELGHRALRRPRVETLMILVGSVSGTQVSRPAVAWFDDLAYDEAHEMLERLRPALVEIGSRARARAEGPEASAA